MSRMFEGSMTKLSEESGYSYNFLVNVWNIADMTANNDWLDNFEEITMRSAWWHQFTNKSTLIDIGRGVLVKDGDSYTAGFIDDIIPSDQCVLVLYEVDGIEKTAIMTFNQYVKSLVDLLRCEIEVSGVTEED